SVLTSHNVKCSIDPRLGKKIGRRETNPQLHPDTLAVNPMVGESDDEFKERVRERFYHYKKLSESHSIWLLTHGDVMRQMTILSRRRKPDVLDYHNHVCISTTDRHLVVDYQNTHIETSSPRYSEPSSSTAKPRTRAPPPKAVPR